MNREFLPNRNSFTRPIVSPANWNKPGASVKTSWRIRYRYYDPVLYPQGKQFTLKQMNGYHTLPERREATREAMRDLLQRFKEGFNPITNSRPDPEGDFEIRPSTGVIPALQFAFDHKVCGPKTKIQLRQALAQIKIAIRQLEYDHLSISEIRRRHVKFILDRIGKNKKGWSSATNFNNFRSSLKMLFDVLDEVEAIEVDPVSKIRKMQITRKIRETLTADQRITVNDHLRTKYPEFYRFLHIFFHSGARVSELLRLTGADIDLAGQRFKVTVIKGKRKEQVWKTIKDIAVPFWEQLHPQPNQFVFSKGLIPGESQINPLQITRRWRNHVKAEKREDGSGGLGITADFYSLKHSHSSEVVDMLSTREAAEHNSHADESMVAKVYDIRRAERQRNRVKTLNNPL